MLTYSGIEITPDNLQSPSPMDLAVQMSRICRYGGAVWCSLLFHSFLVAEMVDRGSNDETWAWALLHDAHEVILGDIPHPWKRTDYDRVELERQIDSVIIEAYCPDFNFNQVDLRLIKDCDRSVVYVERELCGKTSDWLRAMIGYYVPKWDADFQPVRAADGISAGHRLLAEGFNSVRTDLFVSATDTAADIFESIRRGKISDARRLLFDVTMPF